MVATDFELLPYSPPAGDEAGFALRLFMVERGSETAVSVAAEGSGQKTGVGASAAAVAVQEQGAGQKTASGEATSRVSVVVEGAGRRLSGFRLAPPIDLTPVGVVATSRIEWVSTEPEGTFVLVETSLDDGATWQRATNGGPIPGITPGMDLAGKSLLVRQVLMTLDPAVTPVLQSISVQITTMSRTVHDGPEISEFIANYRPATEVINRLAEVAGFVWFIDQEKRLHFVQRGEWEAPWTLTPADMRQREPQVEHSAPEYRNRQYIVDVLSITDPQAETMRGDGEARAFPLRYPIAEVPTVEVSRAGGPWEPQTVGIRGVESGRQWYWNKGDAIISQDDSETPLTENDRLRVTYRGQFYTVVISEDAHQIAQRQEIEGGSGIVEAVDRATQDTTSDAAFQIASAKLREYGRVGRVLTFRTLRPGLWPGMLLPVQAPEYGFTGQKLLIESVTASDEGPLIWYDVTAVEGPRRRSWTAFFSSLVDQAVRLDRIAVGEDRAVTLLVPLADQWTWTESQQVNVFACPVPSTTLYPSSTLYPC